MRFVTRGPLPSSIQETEGKTSELSVAGFGLTVLRMIRVALTEPGEATDVDITASCAVAPTGTDNTYKAPAATAIRKFGRRVRRPADEFGTNVMRRNRR